jgi:hypothetical protein
MKDQIKKEALELLEQSNMHDDKTMASILDQVVEKTTDEVLEAIRKQFTEEFQTGNLKHDFIISPEYYLELKLKEVKQNFFKQNQVSAQQKE